MNTKSTVGMNMKRVSGILGLGIASAMTSALLGAGAIPEPDTIFYGQVLSFDHGNVVPITQGTLVWKIAPHTGNGRTIELRTTLEPMTNGVTVFAYKLKVPHEALVGGLVFGDLSPQTLALGTTASRHRHVEIRVDGIDARIVPPASTVFDISQATRSSVHRLDLEAFIPLPDTDGRGLPDWWQREYFGNLGVDPGADPDGDGWTNLQEYKAATDPTTSNVAPGIVLDNLAIDEGSTEVVSLRAIDSDTPPAQLVYTVLEEPVGARLQLLFGATARGTNGLFGDRWLKQGETFTQSDVNEGRLVIAHEDPAVKSVSYKLRLSDGALGRVPRESVLTMAVHPPTALDGTGAAIWMSSRFESGSTLSRWADASGPKPWLDGTEAAFDANAVSTPLAVVPQGPLGQPVLSFNPTGSNAGQALTLPTPEKATVFPPGEMTVLAVMKPTGHGETAQQVVAGPHFQLGLTGPEDNGRDQQLRFAAEGTGVIYGNHRLRDRWAVVSAWQEGDQLGIEVNGSGVGGPHPLDPPTVFGTAPVLGARSDGGQIDQAYEGFLGEVLVFNRSLDDQERHRIAYSLMGKWFGWVLLDGSDEARDLRWRVPSSGLTRAQYENDFIPKYGPDRNYILLGGWGHDTLEGGQNDDILVGGRQADVFTGGAGSDIFVFNFAHINHGADTIQDFRPVIDHDIINLAGLLRGEERDLRRYLRLMTDGHSSQLDIDFNGNAQYTNHTIHLKNVVLRDADLATLWANGNLLTGDKRIPLNVSLKTTIGEATEITGAPAVFSIHFDGTTVPVDLEMPFELSGSAVRNVDYTISMQQYDAALQDYVWEPVLEHEFFVRVKPGDYDFEVRIEPLSNARSQNPRSVQMRLTTVPEWFDVTTAAAVAQIVDGPQRVGVASTDRNANEAGDIGVFTMFRDGSLDIPLDVVVRMTGPAVNGVDYAYVPRLVQFKPGQSRVDVEITPYADNEREFPEVAELIIEPAAEYFVDTVSQAAAVVIQDSGPVITVEAIEPLAVVKDGSPGAFLLHRRGMINETLVVSLDIGGTATMNLDYQRVNRFVTFGPGANSVLVTVQPLETATLRGDLETVDLKVLPATGYEVGPTALAQVRLVPEYATFVQWKARHFPGDTTPVALFAEQDADSDGVRHLIEYAHGLNPLAPDAGSSNLPHPVVIGGRFGVRFSRPAAALDLDFLLEISTDLKTWVPAKDPFEMFGEPLQDFGMESVTFLERMPMDSSVFRFVRVRAVLQ